MVFLFVLFFYFIAQAEPTEVWDTSHTQKIINSKQTIQSLKEQKECNNAPPSVSSVLNLFETLNKEETIQAIIDPYKKKFLCEVNNYVAEQNQETMEDQKFMLNYLDKKDQMKEKDHLKMTELLIKYRMLRGKNGEEYFVSATRFQPPEETKKQIRKLAEFYMEEVGKPMHCFFVSANKIKQSELAGKDCREEVFLRVHPVPIPLVVTQSVLESNWGNSSLAQEESNILGLQVKFRNPSTMSNYPNCRPAKKAPDRCLLKFDNYKGSIYEYFSRFNASHLGGYSKYRQTRKEIYHNKDWDSCKKAVQLSDAVDFYAENPNYVTEIQSMINTEICQMMSEVCLEPALTARN